MMHSRALNAAPVSAVTQPRLARPTEKHPCYRIVWAEKPAGSTRWVTRQKSTRRTDYAAAQRVLTDFLQGFGTADPVAAAPRMDAVAAAYLAEHCAARSETVVKAQRGALRPILQAFADRDPHDMTPAVWLAYTKARANGAYGGRTAGRGARRAPGRILPQTIRRELGAANAMLKWAASHGRLDGKRLHPIPLPHVPDSAKKEPVWLDEAQLKAVLEAADQAPPSIKVAVYLLACTGARREAVLNLVPERVDLGRGTIDFREPGRTTGRKRRAVVSISRTLRPVLAEAMREARPGQSIVTSEHLRTWQRRFDAWAAKLDLGGLKLTPHVFRHTFVTLRLRAGMEPWKIAGAVADNVQTILNVYGHHRPDHLAAVMDLEL